MTTIYHLNSIYIKKHNENLKSTENHKTQNMYSITNNVYIKNFFTLLDIPFSNHTSNNTIQFKASSVQTLVQLLSHKKSLPFNQILNMLYTLGKQLLDLEKENKGILFFDLHDILVINDNTFIFMNIEKILPIEKEHFNIQYPISLDSGFLSPELHDLKDNLTIPFKLYYKTSYYSFGLLLLYCLYGQNNDYIFQQKITEEDNYTNLLNPIHSTKLYYFLKRCLHIKPDKRFLIFI